MAATTGALESCGREPMSRLGCDVTCRPFWAWVVVRFVSDRRVDPLVPVVISIAFALGVALAWHSRFWHRHACIAYFAAIGHTFQRYGLALGMREVKCPIDWGIATR